MPTSIDIMKSLKKSPKSALLLIYGYNVNITGSRYQAWVTGRVFGAVSGASFSEWLLRTGRTVDRHRYILLQAKVICEFRERD